MRNRVMLAAGTLAIVPTLLFAQQRPAQQPAQRPAQRPPAAQPAQRPAPAPARPMAGARDGTWELSAGVGVMGVGSALNDGSSTAFMPGGTLRVGYNLSSMWNISVGTGLGYGGKNSTAYLTPGAAVTWTPDINKPTSPFVMLGVGLMYVNAIWPTGSSVSKAGVELGVGVRHMVGDNLALRVEGGATVTSNYSQTTGAGLVTVGLSYFVGGKHVLTHIAVNPGTATLASLRQTQQFSATAHDQKGRPMAGKVFGWRSSNPAVATVSNTGVVTAVGDGSATISAMSEGVTGSANVMVSRTAAAVAVAPTSVSLNALGATQPLTATARDPGNSPVNATFTWTSSNPAVATVSASGLVTAVGNGTANITLASSGKTATASVTVAQMTASINVTPATTSLTAAGATSQLAAQALDANGRPINGKTYTWTSDAAGVATVNNAGLATAVANGVAHFSAATDGKTGSAIVTVVVATRGVPPVELPAVAKSMVLTNVTFHPVRGRPTLTPAAMADLDKFAIAIQGMPSSKWEIGSFTSNVGRVPVLTARSQREADAVKAYLISKGVPAASVTAVGHGPANPIGSNRTAAGRRQNNRIEIKRVQ